MAKTVFSGAWPRTGPARSESMVVRVGSPAPDFVAEAYVRGEPEPRRCGFRTLLQGDTRSGDGLRR